MPSSEELASPPFNDSDWFPKDDDPRFIAFAQKIGVMPKAAGNP